MKKISLKKRYDIKRYYGKDRSFIVVLTLSVCLLILFYCVIYLLNYYGYMPFTGYFYLDMAFLAVLFLMGPIGFYNHIKAKKKKEIQDKLPDFLVEIGNSVSAGMTVFEAVKVASKGDYGKLTPEIQRMTAQLSWGVPIRTVFSNFAQRMKSTTIERIVVTINRSLEMGGSTSKIFKAAAKEIEQVKRVEEQRKANMATYSIVIIMSFFVFLAVILIIDKTIFVSFFDLQQKTADTQLAGMQMNVIDPLMLKYALYSFVFVQSVGAGILGGFMMDGKISSGIRYSFILVLISFFVFKFLF
jgi:flagellar protein FlaJ